MLLMLELFKFMNLGPNGIFSTANPKSLNFIAL